MTSTYKYPSAEPFETGHLAVDSRHRVYYEVSGNPDGLPVIDVHGGPGAGSVPDYRRLFDPEVFKIVLFDQRGCGKSEPACETRDNTTQHLMNDMEALREHIGADKWIVTGWSWGTTLSLAYAQAHPHRVLALVLRGTWTARQEEADWFDTGLQNFFPDSIENLDVDLQGFSGADVLQELFRIMSDESLPLEEREAAARSCHRYELNACYLEARDEDIEQALEGPQLPGAMVGAHYWQNQWFLNKNQLWDELHRIHHIPCTLIHGRYDVVAIPRTSWEMHKAWPGSELIIAPQSGHLCSEPRMAEAITRTMDKLAKRFA